MADIALMPERTLKLSAFPSLILDSTTRLASIGMAIFAYFTLGSLLVDPCNNLSYTIY
jgi:hypothetical protein